MISEKASYLSCMFSPALTSRSGSARPAKRRANLASRRAVGSKSRAKIYVADKPPSKAASWWPLGRFSRSTRKKTTPNLAQPVSDPVGRSWLGGVGLMLIVGLLTGVVWGGWWLVQQLRPWPNPTTLLLVAPAKTDTTTQPISAVWLWYYPAQKRARVVYFQPDFRLNIAGGYGQYPLDSLWPLLKLDHRSQAYFTSAAGLGLGTPLTRVIPVVPNEVLRTPQEWQDFFWNLAKTGGTAELPFLESWQLGSQLGQVSLANWEIKTEITNEQWELAKSGLPSVSEVGACSVAIVNTTSRSGLANRLSLVWEAVGLRVVKTADNLANQARTTLVRANGEDCDPTQDVIEATFAEPISVSNDPEVTQQYRADIVVLVGQDLAAFWNQ
jgi:hypothetical protein